MLNVCPHCNSVLDDDRDQLVLTPMGRRIVEYLKVVKEPVDPKTLALYIYNSTSRNCVRAIMANMSYLKKKLEGTDYLISNAPYVLLKFRSKTPKSQED